MFKSGLQGYRGSLETAYPRGLKTKPGAFLPQILKTASTVYHLLIAKGVLHRTSLPQLRKPYSFLRNPNPGNPFSWITEEAAQEPASLAARSQAHRPEERQTRGLGAQEGLGARPEEQQQEIRTTLAASRGFSKRN